MNLCSCRDCGWLGRSSQSVPNQSLIKVVSPSRLPMTPSFLSRVVLIVFLICRGPGCLELARAAATASPFFFFFNVRLAIVWHQCVIS